MPPRRSESRLPVPESFLPLPRDTFHILVSLADRERHGYSVMQDVAERTDGALRLSPSSLYASIKRLLGQGLIEELDERPDPKHDDERRRYYRLSPGPAGRDGRSTAARPSAVRRSGDGAASPPGIACGQRHPPPALEHTRVSCAAVAVSG